MTRRWQPCLWILWLSLESPCAATCADEGRCEAVDAVADEMYVSLLQESVRVSASMLETLKDTESVAKTTPDDSKEAKAETTPDDSDSKDAKAKTASGDSKEAKPKENPESVATKKQKRAEKLASKDKPKELDPDAEIKNRLGPEYTITYKFPKAVWIIFAMAGCTWVLSMVLVFYYCYYRANLADANTPARRPFPFQDEVRRIRSRSLSPCSSPPLSPGGTTRPPLSPGGGGIRPSRSNNSLASMGDTVAEVEATLPQKCMAEAVGTFLNVLGGCSVGAADKYLHCGLGLLGQSIAWGVSVALSIFCAREVSGGHCNPAATVAMWFHNGFPLRHVPFYIASQLCGAMLAGTMVYGMFSGGIAALEVELKLPRGTSSTTYAGAFGLVPGPPWLSGAGAFGVEFVATTFLIFIVFTVTDWEGPVPKNAQPLLIGTAAALMIAAFGALDGSGMNPARDTGPRIVCYFAGWGYIAFKFWWAYLLGPLCGGVFGGWIYNRFFKSLSKQAPSTPEM